MIDKNKADYVPLKLSSCGKIGIPAEINIKDYSFDDASSLAGMREDIAEEVVLSIMKNVIYEDVDVNNLTLPDIIEIMMTIQGTFHNSTIEKTIYDEKLKEYKNVSINIKDIKTISLADDVKLPISIKDKNHTYKFTYPRVSHIVEIKNYIGNTYYKQEKEIQELKTKTNNYNDKKKLQTLEFEKNKLFTKCLIASQLIGIDDKELKTLEEKLNVLDSIDINIINLLNKTTNEKFKFGLDENVPCRIISDEKGMSDELVVQKIPFQLFDAIQIMGSENNENYTVSFG